MKKEEKQQIAAMVVRLFREGKLEFSYLYNPLLTFEKYDCREDHQFVAEYNGLSIRLMRRRVMIDNKEPQQTDRHSISSIDFTLTKELKEIYEELYCRHEAEISEVTNAQKDCKKTLRNRNLDAQYKDDDTTIILEKLQ